MKNNYRNYSYYPHFVSGNARLPNSWPSTELSHHPILLPASVPLGVLCLSSLPADLQDFQWAALISLCLLSVVVVDESRTHA